MKLIIFAALLLIGSVPNIFVPENTLIGIIGTIIGIAIIAFKIKSSSDSDSISYNPTTSHSNNWQSKSENQKSRGRHNK